MSKDSESFSFFSALGESLRSLWTPTTRDEATIDGEDHDENDYFPDPIEMPIESEIDLHTFSPKDIRDVVREYCREAGEKGFEEVRIVHGKGKGVQRKIVHSELAKHPHVVEYWDAPPGRGHWGATFAKLKREPKVESKS